MKYIETIELNEEQYQIIPPMSTEQQIGGVKTKAKTNENVSVAIDENGQIFVPTYPSGNDKLDIQQGTDNANKVMMVDESGNLVPTEFKGGSDNKLIASVEKSSNPQITDGYQTEMVNLKLYGKSTQETTTGKNLFSVDYWVKNGYWYDSAEIGENIENIINDISSNSFNIYKIEIEPQKSYTIKSFVTTQLRYSYAVCDESGIVLQSNGSSASTIGKYYSFTTLENAKYLWVSIMDVSKENTLFQLELGETPTSYEPYTGGQPSPSPQYPQPITAISQFDGSVIAKNLCDLKVENLLNKLGNGNVEKYENGVKFDFSNTRDLAYKLNIELEKNTQYTIEFDILRSINQSGSEYKPIIISTIYQDWYQGYASILYKSIIDNHAKLTFTTDTNLESRIYISGNNNISNTTGYTIITNFIITKGSTDTSYTHYQEPIPFTYTPSQPMYSTQDGSISDYVDVEKGVEVYNMSGAVVFDGSEDEEWSLYKLSGQEEYTGVFITENNMISSKRGKYNCNIYQATGVFDDNVWFGVSDNRNIYFPRILQDLNINTIEEWETWLSQNPITVVYPLATPTEIPIDPTQLAILRALYTYTGVTNFLCNGDVSFDYEQSVDIVIKNILSAINQTNANLLLAASKEG